MKRISIAITVIGLVALVGCGNFSPTGPSEAVAADKVAKSSAVATTPILSFSLSQATVSVGEEVTVDVIISDVVDLYGVATTILFDNSKLQFVRAEEERLVAVQNPTAFMSAVAMNRPDKLVIGLASLGKVPGVTGYGTLFRIIFKALAPGETDLRLIETTLCSSVNEGEGKQKIDFESRPTTVVIE